MKRRNVSAELETIVELPGHTYDVYVEAIGRAYLDPGKTYGPPEKCYPPEGEMEVLAIKSDVRDITGNSVTAAEEKYVLEVLGEEPILGALWAAYDEGKVL